MSKQIIAFIGRAGSGKDYQCSLLKEQGFIQFAFADGLRSIAFHSLNCSEEQGIKEYDWLKANDCITLSHPDGSTTSFNFRKYLELLGTQGIRKYDNDFWCKCLIENVKKSEADKVCISDMRFPNEYYYLKRFSEANNYDFKVIFCNYKSHRYQEDNKHESARMGNWFSTHGYEDLQEIKVNDMENYITCGMYCRV